MLPTNANISPVLIDMFVVYLFQSGCQEDGEGRMNVDLSKHATAFLLQARETHRMTQVIYAINFPNNCISFLVASLKEISLNCRMTVTVQTVRVTSKKCLHVDCIFI